MIIITSNGERHHDYNCTNYNGEILFSPFISAAYEWCEVEGVIELLCNTVLYNGKRYTEDYWRDNSVYCENLREDVLECDTVEHNNRYYSIDYFERYFSPCQICGDPTESSICSSCSDDYFYCERCEEYINNDDYGEDGICCSCMNEDSSIYRHDYKPFPRFKYLKNDDRVYFGLENEAEGDRTTADKIDKDFWYCKEDGSLQHGFEMVSHPATYNYLMSKKEEIGKTLKFLADNGMKSYDTTTCGMHIHISKNHFTSLDIYKFLDFFYKNQDFIFKISQRKKIDELSEWASLEREVETVRDRVKKSKDKNNTIRYSAINLQNSKTIEFRIFKGTLKVESFYKNIQFVKSLSEWVKITSIKDLTEQNFKNYISQNKKTYSYLFNFIHERAI